MKTLYLARHAKSSWKYPKLDDFERPLNKRGRRDAPFMGGILKKLGVKPDLLISSPANRASTTARIIADKIDYPLEAIHYSERIYGSSANTLIDLVEHLADDVQQAMLVGHNPGLTDLANYLGDYPTSNIPTSGIFCVDLNVSSWADLTPHGGKLRFFEYPKKHT